MIGIRLANSRRMLRLIVRASALAARNLSYSYCCEFSRRMRAAPRMLSLMTLFSRSIACIALVNSFCTPEHHLERDPDHRQHHQDGEAQPPVDREEHVAGADDQE